MVVDEILIKSEINIWMQMLLFYSLNIAGVLCLVMGTTIFKMNRSLRSNKVWLVLCVASFLCCSSYGWLSVAQTYTQATIIRSMGLIGLYYWTGYSAIFIMEIKIGKKNRKRIDIFTLLVSILVIPLVLLNGKPGSVTFVTAPFGVTFETKVTISTIIFYYTYIAAISCLAIYLIVRWYMKSETKRERKNIINMSMALGIIPVASIPNIIMPALGYGSFPGTAFGGFAATYILYLSCRNIDSETVSIEKVADRIVRSFSTPILLLNHKGEILNVNGSAEAFIGKPAKELRYNNCDVYFRSVDENILLQDYLQCAIRDKKTEFYITKVKMGEKISCHFNYGIIYDRYEEVLCVTLLIQDISKLEENMEKLEEEASRDFLTGLYNRRYAEDRISAILKEHEGALVLFDIDNFKCVNDTYGHKQGDYVLKATAKTIEKNVDEGSIAYRLGGDEFGLFIPDVVNVREIEGKILKILNDFKIVMQQDESTKGCSFSAGIMLSVLGADNFEDLYSKADKALYHVKMVGKGTCFTYIGSDLECTEYIRD